MAKKHTKRPCKRKSQKHRESVREKEREKKNKTNWHWERALKKDRTHKCTGWIANRDREKEKITGEKHKRYNWTLDRTSVQFKRKRKIQKDAKRISTQTHIIHKAKTKGKSYTLAVWFLATKSYKSLGKNATLHFKPKHNSSSSSSKKKKNGKWNDGYKWNEECIKCHTMYVVEKRAAMHSQWVARWVAVLTKHDDDDDDLIYGKSK